MHCTYSIMKMYARLNGRKRNFVKSQRIESVALIIARKSALYWNSSPKMTLNTLCGNYVTTHGYARTNFEMISKFTYAHGWFADRLQFMYYVIFTSKCKMWSRRFCDFSKIQLQRWRGISLVRNKRWRRNFEVGKKVWGDRMKLH